MKGLIRAHLSMGMQFFIIKYITLSVNFVDFYKLSFFMLLVISYFLMLYEVLLTFIPLFVFRNNQLF